ncbi:MAG: Ig-like domain-containing protein [Atribacterota bacterium]|nr:Ig-like domain-containing protein [Atribacterota bacterium]
MFSKIYLIIRSGQMLKKKLFFLPFILGLFMLSGCGILPVAVTGVTLDQPTMTLTAGGATGTLVATVAPANATNQSITWSSSASAVATVVNGVVTPLTAGITTIQVITVDGGLTAKCEVIVTPVPVAIGDSYGGGIVAYILQSGDDGYDTNVQHGLIAATIDQSERVACSNIDNTEIGSTAQGIGIGTGQANTDAIIGQAGHIASAAKLCRDYDGGGKTDWFLPSKDELNQLYAQKALVGGFASDYYWSSSEEDADSACGQGFTSGMQGKYPKDYGLRVRAIRAF